MGRGIAERRVFGVKKSRRLTEFGNRNFSIFGRAAERKWEFQLKICVKEPIDFKCNLIQWALHVKHLYFQNIKTKFSFYILFTISCFKLKQTSVLKIFFKKNGKNFQTSEVGKTCQVGHARSTCRRHREEWRTTSSTLGPRLDCTSTGHNSTCPGSVFTYFEEVFGIYSDYKKLY